MTKLDQLAELGQSIGRVVRLHLDGDVLEMLDQLAEWVES